MKSVFVFVTYFALANASDIDFNFETSENFNRDARFLVNGLNTTMLVAGVGILAGLLLFVLYAASTPTLATENHQKFGQGSQEFYSEEQQFQTRYKRFATNGNCKCSSIN